LRITASNPMSSISRPPLTSKPRGTNPSADDAAAGLLHRARSGDRAAFGQIVVLYQDRIFNAVLRMVGDHHEALELTQEAFTKALGSVDQYRGDAAPYTWMFRIAVNLTISRLRKEHRHRTFSLDGSSGSNHNGSDQAAGLMDKVRQNDPSAMAETRERAEQVVMALGRVDPEYRAVLIMRDVEGFDYQQMADVLGLPLGTLKSRLFRARTALRDELKAYMGEKRP
jgi:RNA polymerase sigma-70 factor (ECF subfamily)